MSSNRTKKYNSNQFNTRKSRRVDRGRVSDLNKRQIDKKLQKKVRFKIKLAEKEFHNMIEEQKIQKITPTIGLANELIFKAKNLYRKKKFSEAMRNITMAIVIIFSYNPAAPGDVFNKGKMGAQSQSGTVLESVVP